MIWKYLWYSGHWLLKKKLNQFDGKCMQTFSFNMLILLDFKSIL